MTTLNSEEITLCSDSVDWEASICFWVSLTTLNSKEITLCSDSVARGSICLWCLYLYICTGISLYFLISAFESQWQHWTVKRSLCALTVLTWGFHLPVVYVSSYMHLYFLIFSYICLWVSLTTLKSEEITLCSVSVDLGGSICLWCLYLYICTDISLYFLISAFESHWQHWTVKRSLCALRVLTEGVHLPLRLIENIEQWRDHSVLCQCWLGGGPFGFGVCIFKYTQVFPYIFLYLPLSLNDNIEQWRDHSVLWQCWPGGIHLPLSLIDNIEQQRDHSVLWQCCQGVHLPVVSVSSYMHWYFLIFSYICLWVSMTTLNSAKRSLCALTVLRGGSICLWCLYLYICTGISLYFLISAFESHWQHWTVKRSLCALTVLTGGHPSAFESHWQHWTAKRSLCALTILGGGPSACGVCIFIYTLVFPYIFLYLPLSLNDNIEQWRDHSVLWQCWPGGIHLPLSLIDNIEQQRDHSVLW